MEARSGLLNHDELDADWDPATDKRLTVWEVVQYLILRLREGGEHAAADLLRAVPRQAEPASELTYRLYHICEREGWTSDALAYNGLVASGPNSAAWLPNPHRSKPNSPSPASAPIHRYPDPPTQSMNHR